MAPLIFSVATKGEKTMANNNYYPNHRKAGLDIPDFMTKKNWEEKADEMLEQTKYPEPPTYRSTEDAVVAAEMQKTSQNLAQAAQYGEKIRKDGYHLKELDATIDAITEDEAKVVARRLVTNYPNIVLAEVSILIDDMQQLSASIIHNSKAFANRREQTPM